MSEPMVISKRIRPGSRLVHRTLSAMSGAPVAVPDPSRLVHLQLLRFAGCPVCNLHLRPFILRHAEIERAGIREVVVFHSTAAELRKYEADLPFDVIPDPTKALYREFGVEPSIRAVLDPRVWPSILAAAARAIGRAVSRTAPPPPLRPTGGELGLPCDLLVRPDGTVVAAKYGTHAADQWSVDELLSLAR